MTRPAPIIATIAAALLLLLGAYMGGYYAMLTGWGLAPLHSPLYRVHSAHIEAFFVPANKLDRLIRPGYWSEK